MMRHPLCVCGGGQHRQRESGKSIGIAHVVWRNSRRLGVVPHRGRCRHEPGDAGPARSKPPASARPTSTATSASPARPPARHARAGARSNRGLGLATPWSSWNSRVSAAGGRRRSTPSASFAPMASASGRWPNRRPPGRATSKPTRTAPTSSSGPSCCCSARGRRSRSSRPSDVGRSPVSTAPAPRGSTSGARTPARPNCAT